uniref:Uncharacterized protein n=1 Tax=Rhizophora mucronata TaxID=61149 RepID=A0A2P2QS18_RHIMU
MLKKITKRRRRLPAIAIASFQIDRLLYMLLLLEQSTVFIQLHHRSFWKVEMLCRRESNRERSYLAKVRRGIRAQHFVGP